jgi:hypothetical protein
MCGALCWPKKGIYIILFLLCRCEKCLAITGQRLSSNTEIYFSVFIFPSTGVSVPMPWYDMHPQNITDARHVVFQLSRRFLRHDYVCTMFQSQPMEGRRWYLYPSVASTKPRFKYYRKRLLLIKEYFTYRNSSLFWYMTPRMQNTSYFSW